ncbi:MAG TPA: PaaX family transcriptional regulator C-terminal domain-containing protein [Steroidobacteraceae bacterium]|nr:PaaX family transcriptional regulator C-terminal domain-containing protein [Steroidobacteraceae bacterium]
MSSVIAARRARPPFSTPTKDREDRRLGAATARLVSAFRRQRPLRAGSLIVTLFGDAILPRGGAITLRSLIGIAAPFGIQERLVRTAAARLAQDGWLETRRLGKHSEYRLSASGSERFEEATERIYGPAPPWSGRWTLLVLPPLTAAARAVLRRELTWLGFGELSSGVYAHPEMSREGVRRALAPFPVARRSLVFEAKLSGDASPAQLIERGWNLDELALGYRRFVSRFEPALRAAHGTSITPQTGFVLRTLLIHDYRRLHLRDPLLPARLLPADWPGFEAAALCRALYARVFDTSEEYLTATAARLQGPLPPVGAAPGQRSGRFRPVLGVNPWRSPGRRSR